MSRFSKVKWAEGLFLRQHHLQQADRYIEHLLETRTRYSSPYPWGFAELEIDNDMAQRNKFALRKASGIFQDGTPFDMPGSSPLPPPVDVPDGSEKQTVWLSVPVSTGSGREVDIADSQSGSRFIEDTETLSDMTSAMVVEQDIDIVHLRTALDIRKVEKPGFHNLKVARIQEVRDKSILLDPMFVPPVLRTAAHPVAGGWADRVIGWVDTKLETLARYAADPSSGGGMQNADYWMLQLLNREVNVLKHQRSSGYVHPETLYVELLRLAGELQTFTKGRLAAPYSAYDHDDLSNTFEPVLADIQRALSLDPMRAVHLELIHRPPSTYLSPVDRSLFQHATFILEAGADMPLTRIQQLLPQLCKVGPNSRMNEIVNAHLPGIDVVHLPNPPRQIRTVSDRVYFYLDRASPLWPEFSSASALALHFAGNWPGLELDLWAIMEQGK